VIIFWHINTLI